MISKKWNQSGENMEKIVVVSAFITLLITVSSFDGMASETVNVGNYSFTST